MKVCAPLILTVATVLIIHQVQGGDKNLGTLRHLGRHVPGRASPPAGPAPILESKEAKTHCEVFIAIPSNSQVIIRFMIVIVIMSVLDAGPPPMVILVYDAELGLTSSNHLQERRAAIRDSWGKGWKADREVKFLFYLHEDDGSESEVSHIHEEQREHNDLVIIRNEDIGVALSTGQAGVTQRVGDSPVPLLVNTGRCLVPH